MRSRTYLKAGGVVTVLTAGAFFVGSLTAEPRLAHAYTISSAITAGCHEKITTEALRAVRLDLTTAAPLPANTNERALIDDLEFTPANDMTDLGGATLPKVLLEHERCPDTPLPQILIIPIGTMNNLATTIGLTRHPAVKLAELFAAKLRENRPLDVTHLTPLKINDEYGFLYGTGLPVNFLQKYYEDPKKRGRKRALKVILATLGNEIASLVTFRKSRQILTRPVHAKITLPEGNEPPVAPLMTHTGILCASIDQVGLGCRAMPDARSRPGCFMLRSTSLSFWGLAVSLGALWVGLPLPATFDAVVPHLTIDYQEPTIATVDGDMKPPGTCDRITCGPTISFITG